MRLMPSFLILGGIVYFLFFSQYFQIKEVKISGTKTISEEFLRKGINAELSKKIYFFASQDNLFLFSSGKIKKTFLKEFPKIRKVSIKRGTPSFLEIRIEEREMVAIWCNSASESQIDSTNSPPVDSASLPQNCFFIDGDGVIFENAPIIQGNLIFKINDKRNLENIGLGNRMLEAGFVKRLFEVKKNLEENLNISFPEFAIPDINVFEAKSSLGWKIISNFSSDLDSAQMQALKKILDEMKPEEKESLEYFDLRIGGRIYYK